MKRTLVAYYSHTGSNEYLARQIARRLDADLEPIRPRLDIFGLQLLFSWLRFSFGIRRFQHDPAHYDRMVLVGPIWTGQLIAPLRACIRKYRKVVPEFLFATCCGSTDQMQDERFGYGHVFALARKTARETPMQCRAFPIALVLPEENPEGEAIMNTRLSEENFRGEIRDRLDAWMAEAMEEREAVTA